MSKSIFFVRVKIQFAQHIEDLLEVKFGINSIEKVFVEQDDDDIGTLTDDKKHRPQRPFQSHYLFIVKCLDDAKKELIELFEQGIALKIIYRVDKFEISNEEIWKN